MAQVYYQDEKVTLYHGDCLDTLEWLTGDVLVTDPPYGIGAESKKGSLYKKTEMRKAAPIAGDQDASARDAAIALWGAKPRIVFGSWRVPRPEPVDHRLIWHKKGMAPGALNAPFMSQDEEIYVTGDGFIPSSPPLRSVIATTEPRQGAAGHAARIGHPTPKPIGLMELLVGRCGGKIIADPFAGSGSTLIAARNLGKCAIGIEIEERYCEIAAILLSQQVFDFGAPLEPRKHVPAS